MAADDGERDNASAQDERRFVEYSVALADAIDAALPGWVIRSVNDRAPIPLDPVLAQAAADAGQRCQVEIASRIRQLLLTDLDEQRSTPLAMLRSATSYATGVLHDAGVAPVLRDEFDERAFPADVYALSPASFADVDEALGEPGLIWGAAKAHIHLARRRAADPAR